MTLFNQLRQQATHQQTLTNPKRLAHFTAICLLLGGSISIAHANCVGTNITALPYTISTPGTYCLTTNLSTTGTLPGITINADDVVLDLDGRTISGPYATATSSSSATSGISVTYGATQQRNNVVIKNGTVKGFWNGITALSHNLSVTDMRIIATPDMGIWAHGVGVTVSNNEVDMDPTNYTGTYARGMGMMVTGKHARVISNRTGYYFRGDRYTDPVGIFIGVEYGNIDNNVVLGQNNFSPDTKVGTGIQVEQSRDILISRNQISRWRSGISWQFGGGHTYRDNTTSSISSGRNYVITTTVVKDGGGNI